MGPLKGIKVVELAGLARGPFAAMMRADMDAGFAWRSWPPGDDAATPP